MHIIPSVKLQARPRYDVTSLAVLQMQKSMHSIRTADPASLPVEVFLTCCILFTAMQFWIEKTSSASTHVLAANRIIQESMSQSTATKLPGSLMIPKEFADVYIPSLRELISQLCAFSDDFPPTGSGLPDDFQLDFDVNEIRAVSDNTTALDAIDRLLKFILRATSSSEIPQTSKKKAKLALVVMEHKLQELLTVGILLRDGYDWLHLNLHLQVARIMFHTLGGNDETGFDDYVAGFSLIVARSKKLIELDDSIIPPGSLYAHLGVLPPLFFVATKCRQSSIRHEALRLLHDASVSERGWTSCIAFKIAQFVVHEEENILNDLADDLERAPQVVRRVRLHSVSPSTKSRQAIITYDIFSPKGAGDRSQHATFPSISTMRHKSSILYPSHPVVEIDNMACPMPRKVLRACGYSSIVLYRPRVECHCGLVNVSDQASDRDSGIEILDSISDVTALTSPQSDISTGVRGWCSRHL